MDIYGTMGPFNSQKGPQLMKSGGQKWKVANIELNKAIDVPNLPRGLDIVDI